MKRPFPTIPQMLDEREHESGKLSCFEKVVLAVCWAALALIFAVYQGVV